MNEKNNPIECVADAMTRSPATVSRGDSLHKAAELMVEHDCGSLPVVDGGKVVGMITDRDIVTRIVAKKQDPSGKSVSDAMSDNVHTVNQDVKLDEAFELMSKNKVRRLPVVDGDGKVVGIVAQADLALDSVRNDRLASTVESISRKS